jgi:CO/xanthine dehydrogenase Mo-binding subunit
VRHAWAAIDAVNAVCGATGARLRDMPFTRERVLAAMV